MGSDLWKRGLNCLSDDFKKMIVKFGPEGGKFCFTQIATQFRDCSQTIQKKEQKPKIHIQEKRQESVLFFFKLYYQHIKQYFAKSEPHNIQTVFPKLHFLFFLFKALQCLETGVNCVTPKFTPLRSKVYIFSKILLVF